MIEKGYVPFEVSARTSGEMREVRPGVRETLTPTHVRGRSDLAETEIRIGGSTTIEDIEPFLGGIKIELLDYFVN